MTFSTRFKFCKRNSSGFTYGDGSTKRLRIAAGNEINISPRIRTFHLREKTRFSMMTKTKKRFDPTWFDHRLSS